MQSKAVDTRLIKLTSKPSSASASKTRSKSRKIKSKNNRELVRASIRDFLEKAQRVELERESLQITLVMIHQMKNRKVETQML